MANTPEQSLKDLAATDARGFLQAFVERDNATRNPGYEGDDDDLNPDELEYWLDETKVVEGIHVKCVSSVGGCEGGGDHAERVFGVFEGEQALTHIRITGYYASYNGTDWNDDWTFVEPRTVEVVQYFPKSA